MPRRRSLRLGGPEKFMLHLGQATVPVLSFLWLILESVTLLFGLLTEDN